MLLRIIKDQSGQDIVEYGMLGALVSIAAVITIRLLGPLIISLYETILDAFQP